MLTEVKMKVTPELSERVQEIVFANGGSWPNGKREIKYIDYKYLFINEDKKISMIYDNEDFYKEHEFEEIDAYSFIVSAGNEKWVPTPGEDALFSDDGETWKKDIFLCYRPNTLMPFKATNDSYVLSKPLSKITSFVDFLIQEGVYNEYMYNTRTENQRWPFKENYKTLDEIKKLDPYDFIQEAFYWKNTKEGFGFWQKFHDKWIEIVGENPTIPFE